LFEALLLLPDETGQFMDTIFAKDIPESSLHLGSLVVRQGLVVFGRGVDEPMEVPSRRPVGA
jgi:hypothetical protein